MFNVLGAQLYRLKKSKLFWALFIVTAVLPILGMILMTGLMSILSDLFAEDGSILALIQMEGGELTLSSLGNMVSLSSDAALFSILCSSIFLSGEFSGGAIRNMVLANKSRTQIFLSFFSISLIIGFSYFGVSYLSTLACYGIIIGFEGVTAAQAVSGCFVSLFLGLLTIILAQSCVCLLLFGTRRTGATVAIPLLLLLFAPSIITTIVDIVVSLKAVVGQTVSSASLGWIPLYNMGMFNASHLDGGLIGKIILYNVPLAALLATLSWLSIKKCDLK